MYNMFSRKRNHVSNNVSCVGGKHSAVRRAAWEVLEQRALMSVAAPNFITIADGTQNFGDTRRAINYYDVSDLTSSSTSFFNQTPTLSIWTGYEITLDDVPASVDGRNLEEISAIDTNSANGDTYVLSFDSGATGVPDNVGDTQGDYDLYRYNFTKAYSHLISTGRSDGILYTDTTSVDFNAVTGKGIDYQAAYGARANGPTGLPAVTSADEGVPDGRNNTDSDPSNDFYWIDGLVDKVGEVARVGGSSTPFFDQQDIQFVSPEKILLMENKPASTDGGALSNDYSIRTLERVSTSPSAATVSGTTGGYNGNTTESWQSYQWTGDNYVDMDDFAASGSLSEVDGMRYVDQNGTQGVWVSERDGGGDDFSFFDLDFATRVADKQELKEGTSPFPTGFALDENPTVNANSNDGDVDYFDVDENGMLVITESGFNDTPKTESKVITRQITNYNGGDSDANGQTEIVPGGWTASGAYSFATDDDNQTIDTRFGVFNRGQDYIYQFDIDVASTSDDAGTGVGNPQQLVADVYVINAATGAVVYSELNAVNHFMIDASKIRAFTLGDYDANGKVEANDINVLAAAIRSSPTPLTAERYDLTGDNSLSVGNPTGVGAITGDMDYLIRRIAATEYGDTDLDFDFDADDQFAIDDGLASLGTGWAYGDFNGDGMIDADDQDIFDLNSDATPPIPTFTRI